MPAKKRTSKKRSASGNGRPQISDHAELHAKVEATLRALGAKPTEFTKGGGVYDLGDEMSVYDGGRFHTLDADSLRTIMSERIRLYRENKEGTYTVEPRAGLAKSVLSERRQLRHDAIPRIKFVMKVPFFTADGECVVRSGYHKDSETFLVLDADMRRAFRDFDPDAVTEAQAFRAVATLRDVFADFPFKPGHERAAWAHLLALLMEQPLRPIIKGPTPLHVVWAPSPGTGKSLLIDAVALLVSGADGKTVKGEPGSQDEYRKTILSGLQEQKPFMVFDNVIRCVSSAAVSHWATSYPTYSDRNLGKSSDRTALNTASKVIGGNKARFSTDNIRRTVPVMLDAEMEHPASRTEFKHAPLLPYIQSKRSRLLRAVLTIIAHWVNEGMPLGGAHLGSFEAWSQVTSGVLDVVGVPGFLEDLKEWHNDSDDDRDQIDQFIDLWVSNIDGAVKDVNGVAPRAVMSAGDLWRMVEGEGIFHFAGRSPESSMGRLLRSQLSDRPVNGYTIKADGQRRWRLVKREDPSWPSQ